MPSNSKKRSDGEGSIYQRHDRGCPDLIDGERPAHKCQGPWVGVLVVGFKPSATPGGKPRAIRKKVQAPTRSAAAARLLELHNQKAANELPTGASVTVEQWMRNWMTKIAPRNIKPSTVECYDTNVDQYIIPLLGHHRLNKLTPDHIDAAWDSLLNEGNPTKPAETRRPLSPTSVHLAHSVLRRALKVAVQRNRLKVNPAGTDAMDAPPKSDVEIVPIAFSDVDKIVTAAAGKPNGARWSVALALGLRPGEARGLRWSDVDLAAGTLTINQQMQRQKGRGMVATTPKSRAGGRTMVIPSTLLASLKAHRKEQNQVRLLAGDHWEDNDLVFCLDSGRPIDHKTDHQRWYALLAEAGVKPCRLYDARHSAATMMLAQGVPPRVVMELFGHSQLSVTSKYQHAVDELKHDAAKRIEAGVWGSAQ